MRKVIQVAKCVSVATLLCSTVMHADGLSNPQAAFGNMPAAFEPNRGQTAKEFDFLAKGLGYAVGISATHTRIVVATDPKKLPETVQLNFVNARGTSQAEPLERQGLTSSYFIGRRSIEKVPSFGKVHYAGVWPGVDVVYYGNGHELEYDFVLAPGGDPSAIKLRFDGAKPVLNADGAIVLKTGSATLEQRLPAAYQVDANHKRSAVSAAYKLSADGTIRVAVGNYDRSRELVIDPAVIYFRDPMFLYPSNQDVITATGVATDSQGNAYITGTTPLIAVSGSAAYNNGYIYIANSGGSPVFSITFGADDGNVFSTGIAIDASLNLYLTGYTDSQAGFLRDNALQNASGGGKDAILLKIEPPYSSSNDILYASYLGGNGDDYAINIAVNGSGVAYIVGQTTSTNWPVASPPSGQNGFVYAIDTTKAGGASKVFGLALGGSGTDAASGVAVDSNSDVYVGGSTNSQDFALTSATGYQTTKSNTNQDGFVLQLNGAGSLLWSTFLPFAPVNAVSVYGSRYAYATGQTSGSIVTTPNPFQPSGGANHAFFTDLDTLTNGSNALIYSTYLGGGGTEAGLAISAQSTGAAVIGGWTTSSNFPTYFPSGGAAGYQSTYTGGGQNVDGFVTIINPALTGSAGLVYSTFEGTGDTWVTGLVIDQLDGITDVMTLYDDQSGQPAGAATSKLLDAEFSDVPPNIGYFQATNLMYLSGVTTGCVVTNSPYTRDFCPNDNVTREQMAAFIVRAVTGTTNPAIYNTTPYFSDVPPSNPFFPHIQKMVDLGITTGCAAGLFCPLDTIPRWQMAIFMVRARLMLYGASFSYNPTPYFVDAPTNVEGNGIAFPFIQRSYEENITAGCATNPLQYCPDEIVTRWQMASFIMRALFNLTLSLPPNAPLLTGASPNTIAATPGAQLTVTITGVNTSFTAGNTVTVPSGMLTVSNVVVNSATSITATLTAAGNIIAGPQALVVTTGGQNLTLPLSIRVGTY